MAINWNQAEFVSPKLQIVPEQLPLEAGVKVGTVLQDRYDKSYENLTKSEEALRQMALSANEIDRPEVERIYSQYSEQLKNIDKNDLHNARWKTLKLATEAANNYMSMAQRNKEIQAQEELIAKNPIWATTREERLKDFRKGLSPIGWDAEKRAFSNLNISPYSAAADVNTMEKSVKYGSLMKPETFGAKDGTLEFVDASGKSTKNPFDAALVFHRTQTGERKLLKDADIKGAVQNAMLNDSEVKAMINRDLKYLGIDPNNPEQAEAYNQYLEKTIFEPAKSAGQLLQIYDDNLRSDVTMSTGLAAGSLSKAKDNVNLPTVVNSLADSYGKDGSVLRRALVNGLEGETGSLYNIKSWVKNELKTSSASEKGNYQNLNDALDKIKDLSPEEQQSLANYFQMDIGDALISLDDKSSLDSPKVKSLFKELNKHIGATISLDTEIERRYNKSSRENVGFQNVNMLAPHYNNAEEINQLNTWMKTSLSNNDFKQFKGKIEPEADYQISKVTDRPLGNGTGIVIELKDNKTNKTILVEPKDDRLLFALERSFPGISSMNSFKNTSDFNQGEKRSINEILKENEIGNTGMPVERGELQIQYGINPETKEKSNRYYLVTPSGRPVKDENGNIKQSTSYLDLL